MNRILLNTNGIRIAQDDTLLAWLKDNRDGVEVYLQYDGRRPGSHRAHRGGDLVRWKGVSTAHLLVSECVAPANDRNGASFLRTCGRQTPCETPDGPGLLALSAAAAGVQSGQ